MKKNQIQNHFNYFTIAFFTVLLLIVTFMDAWLVFRMTSEQTRNSGMYQLETISGQLKSTINEAEKLTMELAIAVPDSKTQIKNFIYNKKSELQNKKIGAYNVYIAGTSWDIIPDLVKTDDFIATKRNWYIGAINNFGKTYVTPPYVDAATGNICYTVSVMLKDNNTVLGVDYTLEKIQAHINQIYEKGLKNAIIVTDEGIIAGCLNQNLIGKNIVKALPDYAGIFSLAKNKHEFVTGRIKSDFLFLYENLFATPSGNGWYLIVSESDWELYKNSYVQLFITIFLSLGLFTVIIILYLFAERNRKKAESALVSKEEFLQGISSKLREPIAKIIENSKIVNGSVKDLRENLAVINLSGEKLSEMIEQIISYSDIVRTENSIEKNSHSKIRNKSHGMNKRFRTIILAFMILVMIISLYTNISVTYRWGNVLMQKEADAYEFKLSEWLNTQKSILDMFCSIISTNPEMLDDYENTIDYLNRITVQYPEISVTYMTNPNLEHTVYMNNGWQPDSNWHVEERQWYIDTIASETGWNISAPYYDEQTGGYCVTISERVYNAKTGKFLGNFGIDFFMDKLVEILGDSYSNSGYAFLVDTEGNIINHPNGKFQMSQDDKINITNSPYSEIKVDGETTQIIHDYDNTDRLLLATRNKDSKFTVYVVSSMWTIYGKVLVYGFICLVTFLTCTVLVYRLLSDFIEWQDMTNKQIKDSAEAAINAGKAKSRFLAQMSHEIRTPINAVLGMNEMILRESSDENILEYSENIQAAGKTLLSIINSILDFSKIDEGKMKIISVKYDIVSLINNLVNSIYERAKSKSLEFVIDVDENLPSGLFGDDVRITQVLINLLTNAVKYTEKGKIIFSVKDGGRDNNSIFIDFAVKDTGIGIKHEDMGKLFESFERIDEKFNRNIEGTGLGISIVSRLLAMMNTELKVESVYGEGSTFSFRLKQLIVDSEPIGNYSKRLAKTIKNENNTSSLYAPEAKILVVDDNEMNLKVAKNLLKLNAIIPDVAFSGEEAIELIRNKNYHVIFLDHMMPKMDGLETLTKIKQENLLDNNSKVIALTANAVSGAREFYLNAGFDDYISKPIEIPTLEEKLKKYLPSKIISQNNDNKNNDENNDEILEFLPENDNIEIQDSNIISEFSIENLRENLRLFGINIDDGLRYCGGDVNFYIDVLRDYVASYSEKSRDLNKFYNDKNWHDYQILTHSLKSSSKTIGANEIFELAKMLEEAASISDYSFILKNHETLLKLYRELTDKIYNIF